MNPNDIVKGGFDLKQGDLLEMLMLQNSINSLLISEVLKRQIELEQLVRLGKVDSETATNEHIEVTNRIADQATAQKNDLIAKLYLQNPDSN